METLQGVELTGTNRPCGLTLFSKANIVVGARSRADEWSVNPIAEARHHRRSRTAQHQKAAFWTPKDSGGDIEEAIPDPISNSEVKLLGADGTARATVWESRTLPG